NVLTSAFLLMPPALAFAHLLVVTALFWTAYAGRWSTPRGRAKLRLRRLSPAARLRVAQLAPLMAVLALSMYVLVVSAGFVTEPPPPKALEDFLKRPGGGAVLLVMVVGTAPLMEEFAFRGWIQRPLERRIGPAAAIPLTAILFALAHFQPEGIAIRLAGGIALGAAVWAARSIWAGIILHLGWNAGVLLFGGALQGFDPRGGGAAVAIPAALVFTATAAALAAGVRRLREETRAERRGGAFPEPGKPAAPR
ncbi:MAG TPA: type II CAAX endopeptidase family protein, partial [Longimicrobium sp.]|nr:type II CAAX endopeptidase family protein [Longimicrobium sp.]